MFTMDVFHLSAVLAVVYGSERFRSGRPYLRPGSTLLPGPLGGIANLVTASATGFVTLVCADQNGRLIPCGRAAIDQALSPAGLLAADLADRMKLHDTGGQR